MFGSSHRVSALEAWRELSGAAKSDLSPEEQRKAEARFLFKAIAFVFALDLGSQLVLYADTHGWDASAFDPSAVWHSLTAPSAFRNAAFDTVLMAAARVVGFPLIAFAAHRAGAVRAPTAKKEQQQEQEQEQEEKKKSVGGAEYLALGDDGSGAAGGVLRNPLLGEQEQEQEQEQETSQQAAVREAESHFEQARLGCAPPRPEKNSSKKKGKGTKDKKKAAGGGAPDMLELERQADARKGLAMVVLFAAGSVFQVYTGVKCVSYKGFGAGSAELRRGALMGSAVLWINLEAMLTKRLLAALVGDRGHLIPEFHPHRLFHDGKLACHYCDLCGITCKEAYRCKLCDFDCCVRCFSRKDRSRGEGVLRGDKGLKKEENLSGKVYFKRALTLCWPERRIFGLAFLCLGINSAASLALPNFQGQILDKVSFLLVLSRFSTDSRLTPLLASALTPLLVVDPRQPGHRRRPRRVQVRHHALHPHLRGDGTLRRAARAVLRGGGAPHVGGGAAQALPRHHLPGHRVLRRLHHGQPHLAPL